MQAANYIDGEWLTADSDKAIVDLNPADTRDVLAELPSAGEDEVEAALAAAQGAFPDWCKLPFQDKLALVAKACELLEARREAIAKLLTRENGKTLRESVAEVNAAISEMHFQMHHAERLGDLARPSMKPAVHAYMVHELESDVAYRHARLGANLDLVRQRS